MKKIISIVLSIGLIFGIANSLIAQVDKTEAKFNKAYNKNIKKSRINGVYIPKDLNDVYNELNQLSSPNALSKFKNGKEEIVSKKLKLGLGRWMYINWNFYEGSRISHYIKTKYGVSHPEDISEFIIIVYHRYLNNIDANEKQVAEKIIGDRKKLLIERKIIRKKIKKEK